MTTAEYKRQWYLRNRERILEKAKTRDKEAKAAYDKKRRETKGDELRAYDKIRAKLPHRKASKRDWSRKRHMSVKQATPNWVGEFESLYIKEIYHLAVLRSEQFGVKFQVDHIIPLHGKNVCGLHVPCNLQILDATSNIKKKNSFKESL